MLTEFFLPRHWQTKEKQRFTHGLRSGWEAADCYNPRPYPGSNKYSSRPSRHFRRTQCWSGEIRSLRGPSTYDLSLSWRDCLAWNWCDETPSRLPSSGLQICLRPGSTWTWWTISAWGNSWWISRSRNGRSKIVRKRLIQWHTCASHCTAWTWLSQITTALF